MHQALGPAAIHGKRSTMAWPCRLRSNCTGRYSGRLSFWCPQCRVAYVATRPGLPAVGGGFCRRPNCQSSHLRLHRCTDRICGSPVTGGGLCSKKPDGWFSVAVGIVGPGVPRVGRAAVVTVPATAAVFPTVAARNPLRLVVHITRPFAHPLPAHPCILVAAPFPMSRRPHLSPTRCRNCLVALCGRCDLHVDLCRHGCCAKKA